MFSRAVVPACALVALSLLAGCQKRGNAPDPGSEPPPAAPVDVVRLFKDPAVIPAFTVTDLNGRTYSSADLRGKVVLVNFWATWCPPCRYEIPDLIRLQNKYKDQLVVIGVSEDEIPVAQVKQFADQQGMNYPIVMATPALKKIFTGIPALPTTFVLDTEGKLVQKHIGMLQAAYTEAETRVLAGLDTTTHVERVDTSDKARIESAAQAKELPGLDLTHLNEMQKKAVMQALITENCTCGCGLTLAVCRLDDPNCPISLPLAQDVVKKYSAMP